MEEQFQETRSLLRKELMGRLRKQELDELFMHGRMKRLLELEESAQKSKSQPLTSEMQDLKPSEKIAEAKKELGKAINYWNEEDISKALREINRIVYGDPLNSKASELLDEEISKELTQLLKPGKICKQDTLSSLTA